MKRLYRSTDDKKVAGICGGLGEYFKVDPVFFRLLFVFITLFPPGSGILVYLIMWLVVPKQS